MNNNFYGRENADASPISPKYKSITDPRVLYDILSEIWCAETCAPRLRDKWTEDNKTLGQCSITAFLAQDIFGGKVYGILRPGGNYHCYNVTDSCVFDLTSEQFGDEQLCYEHISLCSKMICVHSFLRAASAYLGGIVRIGITADKSVINIHLNNSLAVDV
ncbi:MAG: hypothetical protein ACI4XF_00050, partial [Oscillospiraceae bacterium]